MSDNASHTDQSVRRVCVVGSSFYFMSGISTHTCMLANALTDRYQTSAVLMRKLLPQRLYPGHLRVGKDLSLLRYLPSVKVFDGVDYYWMPSILRAIRFLWRERPEVVIFEWWSGTVLHSFLLLAVCARLRGAKIVVDFHETLDTAEAAYPLVALYVRALSRPFIGLAGAGAVHSAADLAAMPKSFPGLAGKPVGVVPLGASATGVDPDRWSAERPSTDVFRLLFFGTIRPYKGLENLIRAFGSLDPSQAAKFSLTVVGETWEGWTLPAELIEQSRYRDRISFVNDYVTDREAAAYFSQADAVVLPYLRSSASGPLHMAMSHGLPVAVTAVGGLTEAVADYTGARLVKPDDVSDLAEALLELPENPGPHRDPHDWGRSVELLSRLFDR